MSDSEAEKLEKYLAEKAKQDQEKEPEPLSAYDACVLKESAKIHEWIWFSRNAKHRNFEKSS